MATVVLQFLPQSGPELWHIPKMGKRPRLISSEVSEIQKPFFSKGKIRPNLLAVKDALSRSRIGSARSAKQV